MRHLKLFEEYKNENITKISVFDFDGTLIESPMPDWGKAEYEKETGEPYPHKGWWGKIESLSDFFEIPKIEETEVAYNKERETPNTLLVMMTNRLTHFEDRVKEILKDKNYFFDIYNFKKHHGQEKVKRVQEILKDYPNVEQVEIWEDRPDEVKNFEKWSERDKTIEIKANFIDSGHYE